MIVIAEKVFSCGCSVWGRVVLALVTMGLVALVRTRPRRAPQSSAVERVVSNGQHCSSAENLRKGCCWRG